MSMQVELHSADLGSAGLSPTGRINYHLHGASALVYAGKQRHTFKRHGLKGFGRLGFGMLQNSAVGAVNYEKVNDTHVLLGAGLEYMTRSGFGARAEMIYYEEDVRYGQLGLVYRMGKQPTLPPVEIAQEVIPEPTVVAALPVIEPVVDVCSQYEVNTGTVNYITDSDQLTEAGETVIEQLANHLNDCQDTKIRVTGHTDNVGNEQYNYDLAKRRAQRVASMFEQMGIQSERIQSDSFGETMPIETNRTEAGRRENRRVELLVQ